MKKCKIVIRDEVNCKIDGLDVEDRRILTKKFEFEIPGARFLPSVKLGRWNGKVSYFQLGGTTYINLLEEILPYLDEKNYEVELVDMREYNTNFTFNAIDENIFAHKTWPVGHPEVGKPIKLRDYQINIINEFLKNPQSLSEVATGAGKTLVTAALSYSCEAMGRTIVIVPNKSLVTQTEIDYRNLELDVGVYFGDRKELGKTHTICTWQSLNHLLKNTKAGEGDITISEFIEDVVCVIVDECLHGDTLVLTPSGYKPIKDLNSGDKVINFSEKSKTFKEDTVVKKHTNLTKSSNEKMYELTFDTGEQVKVTGNHKFLTSVGWVRADELNENHEIISPNIKYSEYRLLIV